MPLKSTARIQAKDGNRVRPWQSPNPNYKTISIKITLVCNKGQAWNHVWHPSACRFHGMVQSANNVGDAAQLTPRINVM